MVLETECVALINVYTWSFGCMEMVGQYLVQGREGEKKQTNKMDIMADLIVVFYSDHLDLEQDIYFSDCSSSNCYECLTL